MSATSQSLHNRHISIRSVPSRNGVRSSVDTKPIDFGNVLDRVTGSINAELQEKRKQEYNRFMRFHERERDGLKERHNEHREKHAAIFEDGIAEIRESMPTSTAVFEDEHVAAEMELIRNQTLEKRTASIALRYKEGYCAGHDPDGTGRVVTQQDRTELDRQRMFCDSLDQRHEAAINVLRAQQVRQLRMETEKLERQITILGRRRDRELKELEQAFDVERRELDKVIAARLERLLLRWHLMDLIFKKQQEMAEEEADEEANRDLNRALSYMKLDSMPGVEQVCS